MNLFFHPDNVPDDIEELGNMVQPPDAKPESGVIDERMDFMSALSLAVRFLNAFESTKLLDGLRGLYPEAVEERLPLATNRSKMMGRDADYGGGDDEFNEGDDDDDLFM
jgi:hypothetical protein